MALDLKAVISLSIAAGGFLWHVALRLWNAGHRRGRKDAQLAEVQRQLDQLVKDIREINALLSTTAVKSETTWNFLMRRAQIEFVEQGVGTVNSPVFVEETFREQFPSALASKLQTLYRDQPEGIPDHDLMFLIESQMGEEIMQSVCKPLHLHLGACLWLAAAVAKEVN